MNCVAKAVHDGGGRVIGVVPSLVEKGGRMSDYIDVHFPTDNLADRKSLMIDQCDAVVALPGGVGSLDEIFAWQLQNVLATTRKRLSCIT